MDFGLHRGIPFREYVRIPGINISSLKEMQRSPMRYHWAISHHRQSDALTLGTATHTAVLEPQKFLSEYALWEKRTEAGAMSPRRGKDWDAFCAANAGKLVLTPAEFDLAQAMRDAVRAYPPAMRYLRHGEAEVTMLWQDPATGMRCRGRLDWLTEEDGAPVLVGLKTARDCSHRLFGIQAARLGYHLQWAYYLNGYTGITGRTARVVEIVVESEPPHECRVYSISDDVLAAGEAEYQRLLPILKDCEAHDHWPPAVEVEEVLTLPAWVYGEGDLADLDLEFGEAS